MSDLIEAAEQLDKMARAKMDQMYFNDPEAFDQSLLWDGLVALTYDLPRVINSLKE